MIITVLRRYEEIGSAEGMFSNLHFTVSEEDLRWGLARARTSIEEASKAVAEAALLHTFTYLSILLWNEEGGESLT